MPVAGLVLAVAGVAVAAGPAAAFAAPKAPTPTAASPSAPADATGATCTGRLAPTIGFDSAGEDGVDLPYRLGYRAGSPSDPAGQGMNPSAVGYTVTVDSPSGQSSVKYGTSPTAVGQGVPWSNPDGTVDAGTLPAWALDAETAGSYRVTITYDRPVFGMRTAVTDLDVSGEQVRLDGFETKTGGQPLTFDIEKLDDPAMIPGLAPQETQTGNTAYIQDSSRVDSEAENTFASTTSGNINDATGSVYFAFDADTPVQRIEMTYDTSAGSGFWFVPPSIPQACFQPSFDLSNAHEGDTARLSGSLANMPGSGRVEDIGFTYTLPDGVVVADDPKIASACGGTLAAEPGSKTITVAGTSLAGGANACDFGVDVKFTKPGTITFDGSTISGASNLVASGTKPTTVTVAADQPALTAEASAEVTAGTARSGLGSTAAYTVIVTNTGNAPLTSIAIGDDLDTAIDCSGPPLAPGASITCTSTKPYVVSQDDVDAGTITDVVTASAVSALGNTARSAPQSVVSSIDSTISLGVTLEGAIEAGTPELGDEIGYTLRVLNTGTTTVTALSSPATGFGCPAGALAPGEVVECALAGHALTQADLDAGAVAFEVVVDAVNAKGGTSRAAAQVTTTVHSVATATLRVAADVDRGDDDRLGAGDVIRYTAVVTNDGTVTLDTLALESTDGATFDCATDGLAPGASVQCSVVDVQLTQEQIDSGSTELELAGTALTSSGTSVTIAPVSLVTDLDSEASLQVSAKAVLHRGDSTTAVDPDEVYDVSAGDRLSFESTITNTGTVSVESIRSFDSFESDAGCDDSSLAPGETASCASRGEYRISSADVQAGFIKGSLGARGTISGVRADIESTVPLSISIAAAPVPVAPSVPELAFTGTTGVLTMSIGAAMSLAGGIWLAVAGRRRRARDKRA